MNSLLGLDAYLAFISRVSQREGSSRAEARRWQAGRQAGGKVYGRERKCASNYAEADLQKVKGGGGEGCGGGVMTFNMKRSSRRATFDIRGCLLFIRREPTSPSLPSNKTNLPPPSERRKPFEETPPAPGAERGGAGSRR